VTEAAGPGRRRQAQIYLAGVRGRKPTVPTDARRLEQAAQATLSAEAYAYIAGGAGLETTIAANRRAFTRRGIVPRVLRGAEPRDLSVELLGRRLESPFLLAPIGAIELAHPDADLAVARAAAGERVPMIFSSQASVAMEDCAAAMGDSPRWFQLYWGTSNEIAESFVRRAEACAAEAIVLTVDTTMLGWRTRDLDLGYLPFAVAKGIAQYTSDPVFNALVDADPEPGPSGGVTWQALRGLVELSRRYPGGTLANLRSGRPRAGVRVFLDVFGRPSLGWAELEALRALTKLPVVVKGVLHPEDARRAVDLGADGLVVSNHGGRQIDGEVASLDALPAVVAAVDVPVLLDSGIRGGADAFKALALGATAVLIGRPYAYGLAIAGERGVRAVIRNLTAELDLTMGLAGCASITDLTPELLV
jgi:isopentenyl diphosphate isomerase/L-lactate dehydrogenase-like FMN-dependent dehydrogenase